MTTRARKSSPHKDIPSEQGVIELGAPIDYSKYSRKELQVLAKELENKSNKSIRPPITSKLEPLYRALRNIGAIPGGTIKMNLWFPDKNLMNLVFSKVSDKVLIKFKDVPYLEYPFWNTKFKERYGVQLHKNSTEDVASLYGPRGHMGDVASLYGPRGHMGDWAVIRGIEIEHPLMVSYLMVETLAKRGYLDYFLNIDKEIYNKYPKERILSGLIKYAIKKNDHAFLHKIVDFAKKTSTPGNTLQRALNYGAAEVIKMPYPSKQILRWIEEFRTIGLSSLQPALVSAINEHKIEIFEYLFNLLEKDKLTYDILGSLLLSALRSGHLHTIEIGKTLTCALAQVGDHMEEDR